MLKLPSFVAWHCDKGSAARLHLSYNKLCCPQANVQQSGSVAYLASVDFPHKLRLTQPPAESSYSA